jgi:hypothetical protein
VSEQGSVLAIQTGDMHCYLHRLLQQTPAMLRRGRKNFRVEAAQGGTEFTLPDCLPRQLGKVGVQNGAAGALQRGS